MGRREATRDIAIEVRSEPQLLHSIRNLIRGYVVSFGVAKDRVDEIVLAVDEACCNSIRHSYRGDNGKPLYLTLQPGLHRGLLWNASALPECVAVCLEVPRCWIDGVFGP